MSSNDLQAALDRLELRHLRYFVTAAETSHLGRAAERLGISASTLSHQLRQLEEILGLPLFDRVGRGIVLAEAGRVFLSHARAALAEVAAGALAVTELSQGQRGLVRLGVIHTFHNTLLPPLMADFLRRHPGVRMEVEEHPAGVIEDKLAAGALDLGIAFAPPQRAGIRAETVFDEELVLAVKADHPAARRKSIAARRLAGLPLALLTGRFATRHLIARTFAGVVDIVPALELASVEAQINIVRTGRFAAILPERAARRAGGIACVRIVEPTPVRTAALLWAMDRQRGAPAAAFARLFSTTFGAASTTAGTRREGAVPAPEA